jgi:hypothetical protein
LDSLAPGTLQRFPYSELPLHRSTGATHHPWGFASLQSFTNEATGLIGVRLTAHDLSTSRCGPSACSLRPRRPPIGGRLVGSLGICCPFDDPAPSRPCTHRLEPKPARCRTERLSWDSSPLRRLRYRESTNTNAATRPLRFRPRRFYDLDGLLLAGPFRVSPRKRPWGLGGLQGVSLPTDHPPSPASAPRDLSSCRALGRCRCGPSGG